MNVGSGYSIRAHTALIIVAVIYGANYTIAKWIMDPGYLSPIAFVALRIWFAAALFSILFLRKSLPEIKDLLTLFICTLTGVLCNQYLFFEGLANTSPLHAALIMVTTPLMVLWIMVLRGKKLNSYQVWGSILGFAGAGLLIWSRGSSSDKSFTVWGDILVMINAFIYAYYLIRVPELIKKYGAYKVLSWMFVLAAILVIPFGWRDIVSVQWDSWDAKSWFALGFVLLFTTGIAYFLNTYALLHASPALVSNYIYLQPVCAIAISISFQGDRLDLVKLLSAGMIFTGIAISTYKIQNSLNR